jgi:hypothetical protein
MMTVAALDDHLVSAMIDPIVLAPTIAAQIQKEIGNPTPSISPASRVLGEMSLQGTV